MSKMRSFKLGTIVEGTVDVVLESTPQTTGWATIGPMSISTEELLVPVPSVTWYVIVTLPAKVELEGV
jgi:hypothetical protein